MHLDNDEDLVTLSGMYEQLKELGYQLSYARFLNKYDIDDDHNGASLVIKSAMLYDTFNSC